MADNKSNGNGNGNGTVAALEFEKSVKKADFNDNAGLFNYFVPAYGFYGRDYVALPQYLPASNSGFYYHTERDAVLMSTIDHEGVWANAVNIATQKAASWGWEVTSEIALRQKRAQELIQDFEWLGIVDYTTAISAHIKGYLLTGRAFIEIERASSSRFSKVVALHHLDPLACRLTGNPDKPVCYRDTESQVHELNSWEVGIFVMNPSPIERPFFNSSRPFQSAAESVYDQITQMEAIWKYLYEKTTGKRALAIDFVTGISHKNLSDAIISSDADMERKGGQLFKGSILIPIVQGDTAISHVRIDLAGLPNGFDFQEMYDNTLITYCGALGLDVNDLDPRLAQRQSLGSGTQAAMLDMKTQTKGLVIWRQQFMRFMQRLVLDDATSFSWRETSTEELTKEAEMKGKIIANVSAMLKDQIITNPQALNILVDDEVLPREFLDTDLTQANSIGDDEKDIAQPRDPNAPKPETATDSEVILQGTNIATSQPASNGGNSIPNTSTKAWRNRTKHLAGRHNQRNHGNRGDKPAVGSDKHNASQQGGKPYYPDISKRGSVPNSKDVNNTQKLANFYKSNENLFDEKLKKISSDSGVSPQIISDTIINWSVTSNGNLDAVIYQNVASQGFNAPLSDWQEKRNILLRGGYESLPGKEDLTKMNQTIYDHTQRSFSDAGFLPDDKVTLYRGYGSPSGSFSKGEVINLSQGNTLESWTFDIDVASNYARQRKEAGQNSAVFAMSIPIRNIFSTGLTGVGGGDSEVVVFGSSGGELVVN